MCAGGGAIVQAQAAVISGPVSEAGECCRNDDKHCLGNQNPRIDSDVRAAIVPLFTWCSFRQTLAVISIFI